MYIVVYVCSKVKFPLNMNFENLVFKVLSIYDHSISVGFFGEDFGEVAGDKDNAIIPD